MTPEQWRQVEMLYHLALEQEADSRSAFVAGACGGNEALRQEVESLLAADEGAGHYLETSAFGVAAKAQARDEARSNLAGKMVAQYRLLEKLGGGSVTELYRAEDTRLRRPAVIEFLHGLTADSAAHERFQREACAALALNHPHICTVYDIDEWEGVPFIAMEFLEGETLDDWLKARALTIDEFLDLSLQIADGLDAAHRQGLVHRNLQPATLFITRRGHAKILDFGLAQLHPEGLVPGTPSYLSPEQLRGGRLDLRTDVFSLGAVLYEMAARRRAFDGRSDAAILDSVLNRSPVPVLQLNPSMPPGLDDVIAKALKKDPEARYQNVADLRADLRRLKREIDSQRMTRTSPMDSGNSPMIEPNQPARLGRYQLTGRLGAGAMGTVYEGIDPIIGRAVAIKTILPDTLGSPREAERLRERLLREARAAGSLTHPNIVTLFDAGEEAGVTYIVMALIRGSTLDALLTPTGKPLPAQRALTILAEVAAALDYAHSRDVVHRDVKPANIMIQPDGAVKLADFGIAKLVNATTFTMAGSVPGTPCFMSPEQLRGQEATPRSDQYSLAVVAWMLLTGSRPFDSDQLMSLLSQILDHEPPANSHLNTNADRVLRRALAKDPLARFESCGGFVAALSDACSRNPPSAMKDGRMKWGRTLIAGVAIGCLLVGAGIAWRLREPKPQPDGQPQSVNAISPAPVVPPSADTQPQISQNPTPGPAVETRPRAGPPERQAAATLSEKSGAKAPPGVNVPAAGDVETNAADGLDYVWIPGGSFEMGCSTGDRSCDPEENPPHQVAISRGFRMGQTEVTVGAYRRFASATGHSMPPEPVFAERNLNPGWADQRQPVVNATWDEARAFCSWAGLRLPTEAEWEYAARAGDPRLRSGAPKAVAWFRNNSGRAYIDSAPPILKDETKYVAALKDNQNGPHAVGGKAANAFGLRDMLGNVWEWTGDWFQKDYYSHSPGADPPGPEFGTERVSRGGSWYDGPKLITPSRRRPYPPTARNVYTGFRCAGQFNSGRQ
ncbi:MAG TPA: protein kinase [Bryobacteraceae bacterium]|nr:protein kinase [Bryobacteraceae bacterium]